MLFLTFFFLLFVSVIGQKSCEPDNERQHLLMISTLGSSCGLLYANGTEYICNTPITKSFKTSIYGDNDDGSSTGDFFVDGDLVIQPDFINITGSSDDDVLYQAAYAVQAYSQFRANYLTWPEGRAVNPKQWINTYSCIMTATGFVGQLPNETNPGDWKDISNVVSDNNNINSPQIFTTLLGMAAPMVIDLVRGFFDVSNFNSPSGGFILPTPSTKCKNDLENSYNSTVAKIKQEDQSPSPDQPVYKYSAAAGAGMNKDKRISGNTHFSTSFTFVCKLDDAVDSSSGISYPQVWIGHSMIVAENIDQDKSLTDFSLNSFLNTVVQVGTAAASQIIIPTVFAGSPGNQQLAQLATNTLGGGLSSLINAIT